MEIHPLAAADRPRVLALLREAELPVSDLGEAGPARFWVLREGQDVLASGALEPYGAMALVRSVAVPAHRRGEGLGKRIVQALEREAAASGITDLYLLTTTAERFFAGLGYAAADRERAPEEIRGTTQFSDLCPASAVFMHKSLAGS